MDEQAKNQALDELLKGAALRRHLIEVDDYARAQYRSALQKIVERNGTGNGCDEHIRNAQCSLRVIKIIKDILTNVDTGYDAETTYRDLYNIL